MQYLSLDDWKIAARLPSPAGELMLSRLLHHGWIESRGDKHHTAVRLTPAGLEAMRSLIIYHPPARRAGAEGEGEMKPTSGALIYTILVDGKPVVALEARGREAAELCREEWFRSDLCALSSNGEPLCGIGSKLQARPAHEDERARFLEGSKEAKTSDDILFVYLVDLDGL